MSNLPKPERGCDHSFWWRRRRNQNVGYWECLRCHGWLGPVPLDASGHAAKQPEDYLSRRWWQRLRRTL